MPEPMHLLWIYVSALVVFIAFTLASSQAQTIMIRS